MMGALGDRLHWATLPAGFTAMPGAGGQLRSLQSWRTQHSCHWAMPSFSAVHRLTAHRVEHNVKPPPTLAISVKERGIGVILSLISAQLPAGQRRGGTHRLAHSCPAWQ